MASPAQITANKANAQHSTGPRTPEGKQRVAPNAVRHGLTARYPVVRDDQREEFVALMNSLNEELDPQGAVETITFQELLLAAWNLQRFSRIEAEISTGTADDFTNPETTAVLDRLSRYQARAQRAWQKGLAELRTLQTNRALRARKLAEEEEETVPAITSINDLTKQTHSEVTADAIDLAFKFMEGQVGAQIRAIRRESDAAEARSCTEARSCKE